MIAIPHGWQAVLADEVHKPYFSELAQFVEKERKSHEVYPPPPDIFNALKYTSYEDTRSAAPWTRPLSR